MAPAEVKRGGDDYDIPNEADDTRLINESRAEPYRGCQAGSSNKEATDMNVEDGGVDVKKEMIDDAHRNDMVSDVERAILEQKFDSVEDGEAFYNAYAKAKGFNVGEGRKYVVTHFVADHNLELAEQHCVMYLRSHRSLNSADKAQEMAMRNVGVKTSQIMDYMVNQSESYENVSFIRTDLHNHIQAERRAEVEDSDAQGALVLETFMEAMGNKAPVSLLTDGDKATREAIRRVFPDARHRLCNWHLGKNAISNVHKSGFAHAFKQCMDMETNEAKFEHGWTRMVEKFGLQTNSWVLETYEKRHVWAELYEFVRHYDRALAWIRYNEAGDDAETNNTLPVLITPLRDVERHGAELFTRNIFRMFRHEILEEGKLNVKDVFNLSDGQKCYYIHNYKVKDRSWIVTHNPVDAAMRCSCTKFESLGLPCCHMICVMKAENLTQIPPTCVLHRWTRAASKDGQQWPQPSIDSTTTQTARYGILSSSYNKMCFYASQSKEGFKEARDACLPMTSRMKELYERNLNNGDGDKGKHSIPRQFGVEDPDLVKTKKNPGRASSNC
ncbi:protein FAR1-RELATED SEQUENCE 7-like [Camellia sinensis]|uniref:protein FAR1-RELATED SEQUENCE 7-like n=1 Tax=Camellia sinensis TaxID=4442 RepID=UPI00103657CE|nr:protein FAR1-RELATED SEQUENCE 7-like [Camellia sinensis]